MFHILVVEDDQALNNLICRVLNKNGYETASATDGEEALALLDQMYIDLIITDLMMPNMDGYDLTKALRDCGYQLPILVVTARDTFPDKAKGFKLGIDANSVLDAYNLGSYITLNLTDDGFAIPEAMNRGLFTDD